MIKQHVNLLKSIPPKVIDYYAGEYIVTYIAGYAAILIIATLIIFLRNYVVEFNINGIDKKIKEASVMLISAEKRPDFIKMLTLEEKLIKFEKQISIKTQLVELLNSNTEFNTKGFSGMMLGFSEAIRDNIWLTTISIEKGGRFISLTGKTNSSELASKYVENLQAFPAFSKLKLSVEKINKNAGDFAEFTIEGEPST